MRPGITPRFLDGLFGDVVTSLVGGLEENKTKYLTFSTELPELGDGRTSLTQVRLVRQMPFFGGVRC